jgi:hypothetical protein
MSRTGKMNVEFLPYDKALELYQILSKEWIYPYVNLKDKISYIMEQDNGVILSGFVSEDKFINECVPKKFYKIGYKGFGFYIGTEEDMNCEIIEAKKSNDLDELICDEIIISEFEVSLIPEFIGF